MAEHLVQVEQRIAELTRTRDALAELHARAVATEPADCAESQICSILTRDGGG
jgi:hypothetical protein